MAPECLIGEAYNLKADVYSFAIIVWEMLSGETTYSFVTDVDHLVHYVIDKCSRPEIDECWPRRIKVMLKSSFDADINMRPKMQTFCHNIKHELASLRGGDMTGLTSRDMKRRRSKGSISFIQAKLESFRV
mmetsp:Transcript_29622/g.63801  ORF Transcript_29622/g.63801 Transcript_29622/m.63801 type:complete len:131 (+) Transcript_29622:1188-1580(+)